MLAVDFIDLFHRTIIEDIEVFQDIGIGNIHEILVDVIRSCHSRIEIESSAFALAKLSLAIGNQFEGEDFSTAVRTFFFLDEVECGC